MAAHQKNDDLNERITKAIEGQLLALLPPEDIRARVDAVVESFFERERKYDRWQPSAFEAIVSRMLADHSEKVIREILSSPDWQVKVDNNLQRTVGAGLQKVLGFDPSAIEDLAAAVVAENRAMLLGTLLGQILGAKLSDYDISQKVANAFAQAAGIPR